MVVTNFYDLHNGDLAFLANELGIINSDGYHCILCSLNNWSFNCNPSICKESKRTMVSLNENLASYNAKKKQALDRGIKPCNNVLSVNAPKLLPIDPEKIIVPILHCPMGLINKVVEKHFDWVVMDVIKLPNAETFIRQWYRYALNALLLLE